MAAETKDKEHTLHDVKEVPKDKDKREATPRDNEGPVQFDFVDPDPLEVVDPVAVKSTWWVNVQDSGSNDLGPYEDTPQAVEAGRQAITGVPATSFTIENRYIKVPDEEPPPAP